MIRTLSEGLLAGAAAIVVGVMATTGCLVDNTTDGGTGGTGASGGTGGAAGSAGSMSGSGGTAGSNTSECVVGAPANTCAGMGVPVDGVVIDFATYTSDGKWGVDSVGDLTGGTSKYHGTDVPDITNTVENGVLRMTVTIPPMGYAGNVFWFGPCVNSMIFHDDDTTIDGTDTGYSGLSFPVGGSLGGATLSLQVQTHENYPVDGNKGACVEFTDCDTRWDDCHGPAADVTVAEGDAAVVDMPWSSFSGGLPNDAVAPNGLVGLQFQLECRQSEMECIVDITLGTISFSTN